MMKREVLLTVLISSLCLISCHDDSTSGKQQSCKCPEGQTCDSNGVCQPEEPGNHGQITDNNCNPGCNEYEVCENGTCVDPCNHSCKYDEVCKDKHCIKKVCENCGPNEECTESGCVDKSRICNNPCIDDQVCINNECVLDCDKPCGTFCCGEGESCDGMLNWCMPTCEDGKPQCGQSCCKENQTCIAGIGCSDICTETQVSCLIPGHGICCEAGELCNLEEGMCGETCGGLEKCGEDCCPTDKTCVAGSCKIKCTDESLRCGLEGDICCDGATEVCLYNKCLPKKHCETTNDCGFFESCEEVSHNCVDADEIPNTCVVMPAEGDFEPKLQWHWPDDLKDGVPSVHTDYVYVMTTPIAINTTDDNDDNIIDENDIPDVIFSSYLDYYRQPGVLRVISGDDAHEIASSDIIYYPTENLSAGDIDGDTIPEIVATTLGQTPNRIDLLNVVKDKDSSTGYSLKIKASVKTTYGIAAIGGQTDTSIADVDGDGVAEIITRNGIVQYDKATNTLSWRCGSETNSPAVDMGVRPIPADLDGDGQMEIVGRGIYDNHCQPLVQPVATTNLYNYWALADLIPDSDNAAETGELKPEIVRLHPKSAYNTRSEMKVYKVFKDKTTNQWSEQETHSAIIPSDSARAGADCEADPSNAKCNGGGGAPVIADFNGDKRADIGFASKYYYIVYTIEGNELKVLWADSKTHDFSSAATGSSVFDFEGDGVAEVVYGDEYNMHIYTGKGVDKDEDKDGYRDAERLLDVANYNGTLTEYPIIVDVDNDGATEIVISSTNYDQSKHPDVVQRGVRAFEDPNGHWVRTRRIWNQHNYHVTNVNENGSIPAKAESHWLNPRLNSFHQNVQPGGLFNAPNLVAKSLTSAYSTSCPPITLTATVENQGSLGVRAGVSVRFYVSDVNGTGSTGYIGEAYVPTILSPGKSGTATFTWDQTAKVGEETIKVDHGSKIYFVIDEKTDDKPKGEFIECKEDDNRSEIVTAASCPMG